MVAQRLVLRTRERRGCQHSPQVDPACKVAGASQHGADREIAAHGVRMQFVTDPAFLISLAVALEPLVTMDGQVRQISTRCASAEVPDVWAAWAGGLRRVWGGRVDAGRPERPAPVLQSPNANKINRSTPGINPPLRSFPFDCASTQSHWWPDPNFPEEP